VASGYLAAVAGSQTASLSKATAKQQQQSKMYTHRALQALAAQVIIY
jgi:hypothetical protein